MCERFRFVGALSDSDYSGIPSQALVSGDVCKPYAVASGYRASRRIDHSLGDFHGNDKNSRKLEINLICCVVHGEKELYKKSSFFFSLFRNH